MEFNALFKRIEPRIRFVARRHSVSSPFCNGEDLYQEICLYLWKTFKDGIPEGLNDTYIVKGCEFFILNFLRKKREKMTVYSIDEPLNEQGGTLRDILPDTRPGVAEAAEKRLALKELTNSGFTTREKAVLAFLLEGHTVREIGKKIGVSHVAVVKIKKRLVDRWQKKYPGVTKTRGKLLS